MMRSLLKFYSVISLLAVYSLQPVLAANQLLSAPQTAQQTGDRKPEPPPRDPPPFAFEACKAKKAGEIVEVVTPRGDKLKASCTESTKGLFARPERPPERKAESGQPRHEK